MATATKNVKVRKNANKFNQALLESLDYKRWVSREEMYENFGHLVPKEKALKTFAQREAGYHPTASAKEKLVRGRKHEIMLATISLCNRGILEKNDVRGEGAGYRLKRDN